MALDPYNLGRLEIQARHSLFTRVVILPAKNLITFRETAGWPLIFAALCGLVWANWPDSQSYRQFWQTHIVLDLHFMTIDETLKHWINDALLPIFFFVIGVEVKRELTVGELSTRKTAMMPAVMALGGVLIPVGFYLLVQTLSSGEHIRAWGIPVATDIAFALAILRLLGDRMPAEMKLLILAFAAVDDMAGVLVIALVYTSAGEFSLQALGIAGGIYAVLIGFRVMDFRNTALYTLLGILFAGAVYQSGIHTTIAGVLLGLLVRARSHLSPRQMGEWLNKCTDDYARIHAARKRKMEQAGDEAEKISQVEKFEAEESAKLGQIDALLQEGQPSSERLIRSVSPWVNYFVLPIFALANAGIVVTGDILSTMLRSPVAWGIVIGLGLGKPLGIIGFAYLAERLNLAHKPRAMNWHHITGIGLLGGIGFTVAIFIAELALAGSQQDYQAAILAILLISVATSVAGFGYLWLFGRQPRDEKETSDQ